MKSERTKGRKGTPASRSGAQPKASTERVRTGAKPNPCGTQDGRYASKRGGPKGRGKVLRTQDKRMEHSDGKFPQPLRRGAGPQGRRALAAKRRWSLGLLSRPVPGGALGRHATGIDRAARQSPQGMSAKARTRKSPVEPQRGTSCPAHLSLRTDRWIPTKGTHPRTLQNNQDRQ